MNNNATKKMFHFCFRLIPRGRAIDTGVLYCLYSVGGVYPIRSLHKEIATPLLPIGAADQGPVVHGTTGKAICPVVSSGFRAEQRHEYYS